MALFVGCSSAFFRVLPCRGCPSLCHFLTVVPSTAQFSSCQCLTRPSVLFPQHHAIGTNSHYQWCRPDGAAFASQAASPPFAERQTDERDADCLPAQQRIATIPNLICMLRLASTPFLGFLVVHAQFSPACLLFVLIAFTDILDGFIARQFPSQRSLLGSFLDPFADKFLISTLFITLTYMQLIAVPVAIIVLGRDLLLVLSSFFLRFKMLEPPLTGRRFFDPTVSAMRIQPTSLSKYNTFFQLTLVTMSLAAPVFNFSGHFALQYLQFFTALTTVVSGLQYALRSGVLRVKDK